MRVEVITTFDQIDKTAEALNAIGIFDWIDFKGTAGGKTVYVTGHCETHKAAAVFHPTTRTAPMSEQ